MSIVHMSQLSHEDIALLGNNISPPRRKRRPDRHLQAVNRSLATLGERIARLERPAALTSHRLRQLPA